MRPMERARPLPGPARSDSASSPPNHASRDVRPPRDLRLDFLRGFCVVAMLADHFGGASWLYALTGGNRFFVSAAEGFVFLSGLVLGLVYRGEIERRGLWSATRKALRRALTLYAVTVSLTLSVVSISHTFHMPWDQDFHVGDPLAFVVRVATLRQTYALVDVMLLYTILVAAAPVALLALRWGFTGALLAVSWLIWLLAQFVPALGAWPWPVANNDVFHAAPWQAAFVTGIVLGYHRAAVGRRFGWLTGWTALGTAATLLLGLIACYAFGEGWLSAWLEPQVAAALLHALASKATLGPLRVVTALVAFLCAFGLVTRLWEPLRRGLGWLLVPLGQASLYAYVMHLFLIVLVSHGLGYVRSYDPDQVALNTALQAGLAVALWLMVRRRFLFAVVPR